MLLQKQLLFVSPKSASKEKIGSTIGAITETTLNMKRLTVNTLMGKLKAYEVASEIVQTSE